MRLHECLTGSSRVTCVDGCGVRDVTCVMCMCLDLCWRLCVSAWLCVTDCVCVSVCVSVFWDKGEEGLRVRVFQEMWSWKMVQESQEPNITGEELTGNYQLYSLNQGRCRTRFSLGEQRRESLYGGKEGDWELTLEEHHRSLEISVYWYILEIFWKN